MSPPLTIHNSLGATLVGFAVACALLGIQIHQAFAYFMRYHEDKFVYKAIVSVILILELIDQAFIGHFVYYYTISNFANPLALVTSSVTWSIILQQTVGAFVGSIVTFCYALRVWRFSGRNLIITGILIILTFVHLAFSLVFTIKAFALPSLAEVSKITHYGTASLAAGACADIATAFALCYFLNRLRTGSRADTLVNNLVRYAISTGAITSVVSIACLILFNLMPDNFVFISVYFVLSKCYAVSFMATLNTRRLVNGRGTDHSRQSDRPEQLPSSRPTRNFYISASDPRSQHRRGDSEAQIWTGSETKESANQSRHERFSLEVINPPPLYSSQSLSQMSFNSHGSGPRAI